MKLASLELLKYCKQLGWTRRRYKWAKIEDDDIGNEKDWAVSWGLTDENHLDFECVWLESPCKRFRITFENGYFSLNHALDVICDEDEDGNQNEYNLIFVSIKKSLPFKAQKKLFDTFIEIYNEDINLYETN